MGQKGKVTLYMDRETVETAKELGFNISKLCENCLKHAIATIKAANFPKNDNHRAVQY